MFLCADYSHYALHASLFFDRCNNGACYKANKARCALQTISVDTNGNVMFRACSWRCLRWQETQSPTPAIEEDKSVTCTSKSTTKTGVGFDATVDWSTASNEKASTATNSSSGIASALETDFQHDESESFASASAEQWDVTADVDASSAFGESEWSTSATSGWEQEDLSTDPFPTSKELELPCNASASEGAFSPPAPPKSAHGSQSKVSAESSSKQKDTAYDIEPSTVVPWVGLVCDSSADACLT